jgi:hypothetical protein
MSALKERLMEISKAFPAKFEEQGDGSLLLESTIAERKAFLSKKSLIYRARLRLDEGKREVRFFETLKEVGLGISSSEPGGMGPGFGFKKETYKVTGKGREGSVEELSELFGKEYKYSWDYSKLRGAIREEVERAGYSFSIRLSEKDV